MPQADQLLRPLDRVNPLPPALVRVLEAAAAGGELPVGAVVELAGEPVAAAVLRRQMARAAPGEANPTGGRIVEALGVEAVVRTALTAGLVRALGSEAFGARGGALDRVEFWRHCVAVAVAAELAAGHVSGGPSGLLAYACGLLHDVGKCGLDAAVPKSYARVLAAARAGAESLAQVEREELGVDHALAGRRLARHWQLPRRIEEAIWLHHYPLGEPAHPIADAGLIGLVRMADMIARHRGIGFAGNCADTAGDAELIERAGLTPPAVAAVADALPAAVEDAMWPIEGAGAPAAGARPVAPPSVDRNRPELLDALGGFVAGLTTAIAPGPLCERIADLYAWCFLPTSEQRGVFAFHVAADGKALLYPQASGPDAEITAAGWRDAPPPGAEALPAGDVLRRVLDPPDAWYAVADLDRYTLLPLAAGDRWLGGILAPRPPEAPDRAAGSFCALMSFVLAAAVDRERADRLAEGLAMSSQHLTETRQALAQAQALAAIGEMAAGAAHELNNPLAVISGRAQILARRADDDKQRAAAELIVAKAEEISQIAVDLLSLARPAPPSPEAVDVQGLLESARDQVLSGAQSKTDRLRVDIRIWPGCPPVLADADQVREVIAELIGNAARAAQGRVNVRLEASAENESRQVLIRVIDDGPGMAEDVAASAFTPFFSHRPAGRRRGMGLPRARRCVQSHGGRMWIKSRPGGGTTVFVQLPRAVGDVVK